MKILYFAWMREKTGRAEEEVELPAEVATVADLVGWLKTRGPEYEEAFARAEVVRAALDRSRQALGADRGRARDRLSRRSREADMAVRVQRDDFDLSAEVARLAAERTTLAPSSRSPARCAPSRGRRCPP